MSHMGRHFRMRSAYTKARTKIARSAHTLSFSRRGENSLRAVSMIILICRIGSCTIVKRYGMRLFQGLSEHTHGDPMLSIIFPHAEPPLFRMHPIWKGSRESGRSSSLLPVFHDSNTSFYGKKYASSNVLWLTN